MRPHGLRHAIINRRVGQNSSATNGPKFIVIAIEGPAGVRNVEPRISFLQEDPQALPFELMEQKPARLVDSWITGRRAM